MILAEDFVSKNPEFYKKSPVGKSQWEVIYNQGVRNCRRPEPNQVVEVVEQMRPNESELIKKYRAANFRLISKDGVDKFHTKAIRIFKNSSVDFDKKSISDRTREWINNHKFFVNGEQKGIWAFFYEFVVWQSFTDPNSLLFAFPQHNGIIPPAFPQEEGGHPANEPIPIVPLHVSHDKIKYISNDIVAWVGGTTLVKKNIKRKFYYIVDAEAYYLYWPKDQEKLEYDLITWYVHDKGQTPLNWVPGRTSDKGDYRESVLHAYYELADEATARFSDGQGVYVQHAHPQTVLMETDCPDCGGDRTIKIVGKDKKTHVVPCESCNGTGRMRSPGPYNVLLKPPAGPDGNKDVKVLELITPPEQTLQLTYDIPFDLLNKAKQAVGIDTLIDIQESGVAKEKRLENLQDILSSFGESIYDCMERFMYDVEVLLQPNPDDRIEPKVNRPMNYSIKTPEMLRKEAEEAQGPDKVASFMNYYRAKYADNPEMQKVLEFAMAYSPLLVMNEQQTRLALSSQAYNSNDIIRRDYAVQTFMALKDSDNFMEWDIATARERAEQYIEGLGVLNTVLDVVGENT